MAVSIILSHDDYTASLESEFVLLAHRENEEASVQLIGEPSPQELAVLVGSILNVAVAVSRDKHGIDPQMFLSTITEYIIKSSPPEEQ